MCRLPACPSRLWFRSPPPTNRPAPGSAAGLTVVEATELLDLLERRGVAEGRVGVAPDGSFTVRWGGPAGPASER